MSKYPAVARGGRGGGGLAHLESIDALPYALFSLHCMYLNISHHVFLLGYSRMTMEGDGSNPITHFYE